MKKWLISSGLVATILIVGWGLVYRHKLAEDSPGVRRSSVDHRRPAAQGTASGAAKQPAESDIVSGRTVVCAPSGHGGFYRTNNTLAIDPAQPNTLYVSVEFKGLYKSTDGGQTWQLNTKGIKAFGRQDDPAKPCYTEYPYLVIDPSNSQRLLLATSGMPGTLGKHNSGTAGIFESTDGAETWRQIVTDEMNGFVSSSPVIDPKNSATIYFGTTAAPASNQEADPNTLFVSRGVIYKTENGGQSWAELPTGFVPHMAVLSLFIDPANSLELLAFTYAAPRTEGGRQTDGNDQLGPLRSTDGGKTWAKTGNLPSGYQAVVFAAAAPTNFNHLFAVPQSGQNSTPRGFYSTNAGQTFKPTTFLDLVAYDPHDKTGKHMIGHTWTVTGPPKNSLHLFESSDAGASWQKRGTLPSEIRDLSVGETRVSSLVWDPVSPKTIYMSGQSGHVWKSTDLGQSWQKLLSYDQLP